MRDLVSYPLDAIQDFLHGGPGLFGTHAPSFRGSIRRPGVKPGQTNIIVFAAKRGDITE
jgi:hypothetical protein